MVDNGLDNVTSSTTAVSLGKLTSAHIDVARETTAATISIMRVVS